MALIPSTRRVYFYNSRDGDRKYNANSMMDWLLPFFTTGVFNGHLQVTANGDMTVTLQTGYANIKGRVMWQVEAETFDLSVASGNLDRIDAFILRRDDTARDIYPMILTGALATNPTPPALVRDGAIYDIKLADISVKAGTIVVTQADIPDTRMDSEVCGWVVSTVKEIDFSQITAQFQSFFEQYELLVEARYNLYNAIIADHTQNAQGTYDAFADSIFSTQSSAQQDLVNYRDRLSVFESDFYQSFGMWFGETKEDTQNRIDEWYLNYISSLGPEEAITLLNRIYTHEQATVASSANGVHGIRYYGGALQIYTGSGWITMANAVVGLPWSYIDSLNRMWQEWDALNYTWAEFENLIESEVA